MSRCPVGLVVGFGLARKLGRGGRFELPCRNPKIYCASPASVVESFFVHDSKVLRDVDGGVVGCPDMHEEFVPCGLTGGAVEWFEKAERFRGDPLDDDAELFHWLGEGGLEGDRMVKR